MYTNIMILLDIVFDQIIYEYSTCAEPVHLLLYRLQQIEKKKQKDWYKKMYTSLHRTDKRMGQYTMVVQCSDWLI